MKKFILIILALIAFWLLWYVIVANSINVNTLKTLTLDEAVSKFWEPDQKDSFFVNDWLVEFRVGLYNTYTQEMLKKQKIEIQEYTRKKMIKNFTVWYALSWGVRSPVDVLKRNKWAIF